ncbi:hypothetical protein [Tenuibacillus multivorans]|uniref:hypothetical protein n=1 Tax=Tenuibacillus multivorans TaxID=237069 RepID=UPI00116C3C54|nr:hypothetical protein [Tenuibacillus multivorans]GEL76396.1 hypothetical protein TMU01_06310 [Tenuibacillus multivorans]
MNRYRGLSTEKWNSRYLENKGQAFMFPCQQTFYLDPKSRTNKSPRVKASTFIQANSYVFGDVLIDEQAYIGKENLIIAERLSSYYIGKKTNIQDCVLLYCQPGEHVEVNGNRYGVYISDEVSILSHTQPHGPLYIGRSTFIGESVSIYGATIGDHCVIMHGATISNQVKIAEGRYVAPGQSISKQCQADQLPPVPEKLKDLNQMIVDRYHRLVQTRARHTPFFIS